jgi:hypothetical protein
MSRIRVTIDQLALKGFETGERKALVEALQTELAATLADPANRVEWTRSRRTPVLRLGQMPFAKGSAGGRTFGVDLARAIGRGLKS